MLEKNRKAAVDAGSQAIKASPTFPDIPPVSPIISRQDSRHFSRARHDP